MSADLAHLAVVGLGITHLLAFLLVWRLTKWVSESGNVKVLDVKFMHLRLRLEFKGSSSRRKCSRMCR